MHLGRRAWESKASVNDVQSHTLSGWTIYIGLSHWNWKEHHYIEYLHIFTNSTDEHIYQSVELEYQSLCMKH